MPEEKDNPTPEAPESAAPTETVVEQSASVEVPEQPEALVEQAPAEPVDVPAEEPPVAAPAVEAPVAEAPAKPAKIKAPAAATAGDAPAEEGATSAADDAGDSGADTAPAAKRNRRMGASVGIAHIRATFNNTQVSISDMRGGVVSWSTAGRAGFKGSRKSTAFAATMVGQDAARQAVAKGMHEVEVHVQGAGSGRESAIRALQTSGLVVTLIKDVTPMPHNGCRQRKRRRV
ncbi:MAG: 30S ribosomal protein S11 [Lentisphaerae bacterium]|nr:30S ribosomal protein S11 [Lentisphaerota bacterium]